VPPAENRKEGAVMPSEDDGPDVAEMGDMGDEATSIPEFVEAPPPEGASDDTSPSGEPSEEELDPGEEEELPSENEELDAATQAQREWDAERQTRDQERANQRREIDELRARLDATETAPGDGKAVPTEDDTVAAAEAHVEVNEELVGDRPPVPEPPGEYATETDRAKYDKAMHDRMVWQDKRDEQVAERTVAIRNRRAADGLYNKGVEALGKNGEQHREELTKRVRETIARDFSDGELPDPAHTEAIVMWQAEKLKNELGSKPRRRGGDSGTGGTVPVNPLKHGSLDDIHADALRLAGNNQYEPLRKRR